MIGATNADLRDAIAAGRFREDLFYRLNVIELPCRRSPSGRRTCCRWPAPSWARGHSLSPDAEQALLDHIWPGNVRELQNCMRRAVLLAEGEGRSAPRPWGCSPGTPRPAARDASRTEPRRHRERCWRATPG